MDGICFDGSDGERLGCGGLEYDRVILRFESSAGEREDGRKFLVDTVTERPKSSLKPFGDREWPYDQVEHERHNCGGMDQHCERGDGGNLVGERERSGKMDEERCCGCGGI